VRVLYLNTDRGIPVRGTKGASVHVREFTKALQDAGHEVLLVTRRLSPDGGDEPAVPVREIPPPPEVKDLPKDRQHKAYNAALAPVLGGVIAEWKPDLVYERYALFGTAGVRTAGEVGVAHFLEVNAPLVEEAAKYRGLAGAEAAREAERELFAATDRIFVVSEELGAMLGADPQKITVLPNAVDPERTAPHGTRRGLVRRSLGLGDEAFVVGFSGSLKPWHGIGVLLDAFASVTKRLPEARLLLVGDGPERVAVERSASEGKMAGRVVLTGAVGHEEVPGYLQAMDVCTAPYPTAEGFYFSPLKVFEYMAAGRPVVASRAGQISALIEHGRSGLLVEPGDPEALAGALLRVAANPQEAARMGREARRRVVEEHTWERNAQRVAAAFERMREGALSR
jgi:glycosyltransferase involved in cell wall biosynthesis